MSGVAGAALGLAIALEPAYWRATEGYWPRPAWIWRVIATIGVAVAAVLHRSRRLSVVPVTDRYDRCRES